PGQINEPPQPLLASVSVARPNPPSRSDSVIAQLPTVSSSGPMGVVLGVVSGVAFQVQASVKPAAAVYVASTFSFPLALMLAVLLFVVIQSRLDARDPKLRARLAATETFIPFEDEGDL
ncbi:MAG: hypothetical protein Q7S35_06265, partial [Candidatus Limnocylindrales bacterium]|nr:hypothetical protein [Candidatus Limnocylindrales bacterium]